MLFALLARARKKCAKRAGMAVRACFRTTLPPLAAAALLLLSAFAFFTHFRDCACALNPLSANTSHISPTLLIFPNRYNCRYQHKETMPPTTKKPWLISSPQALKNDEIQSARYTTAWLHSNPFPGVSSTLETKAKWLKKIHDSYEQELEESFYMTAAPEGSDVVSKVLLQRAPATLTVQMRVGRDQLDTIALDEEQEKNFADNLSTFGIAGYDGEAKWEPYKKWLLDDAKSADTEQIAIAEIACSKDDKLGDTVKNFAAKFGVMDHFASLRLADQRTIMPMCYNWGLQKIVGENMYYPEAGDSQKLIIPLTMNLSNKSRSRNSDTKSEAFRKEIKEAEEATKNTSDPKTYIFIPKPKKGGETYCSDSEEEDELGAGVNADNAHVLWLPAAYNQHHERISGHFGWGEGEERNIQQRLEKGNTDTGNIKAELFNAELRYAKSLKNVKEKLCAALALTRVASDEGAYWMHDNECPEEIAQMMKNLATLWRTVLLTKTDEELGISAPAGLDASHGGNGGSRAALYAFLPMLASSFVEASEYCKVTFNWKPRTTAPRKKQKTSK